LIKLFFDQNIKYFISQTPVFPLFLIKSKSSLFRTGSFTLKKIIPYVGRFLHISQYFRCAAMSFGKIKFRYC